MTVNLTIVFYSPQVCGVCPGTNPGGTYTPLNTDDEAGSTVCVPAYAGPATVVVVRGAVPDVDTVATPFTPAKLWPVITSRLYGVGVRALSSTSVDGPFSWLWSCCASARA